MTVKTQIKFKEYLKINKDILYGDIILRLGFIFILSMCILIFITNIFYHFDIQIFLIGIALILFLIGINIFKYFQLKSIYNTNKNLGKIVFYTFSNEDIYIKGATFESKIKWETITEITELNSLFLIHYDSKTKSMIPKKDFTKEQIAELRNIINNNRILCRLKND